jgi:hypothetical protein
MLAAVWFLVAGAHVKEEIEVRRDIGPAAGNKMCLGSCNAPVKLRQKSWLRERPFTRAVHLLVHE